VYLADGEQGIMGHSWRPHYYFFYVPPACEEFSLELSSHWNPAFRSSTHLINPAGKVRFTKYPPGVEAGKRYEITIEPTRRERGAFWALAGRNTIVYSMKGIPPYLSARQDFFIPQEKAQPMLGVLEKALSEVGASLIAEREKVRQSQRAATEAINGVAEITREVYSHWSEFGELPGRRRYYYVRHLPGQYMEWRTASVPEDASEKRRFTFTWVAALKDDWGNLDPERMKFQLILNGEPLLRFAPARKSTDWYSDDRTKRLRFEYWDFIWAQTQGLMELTVPSDLLTPGNAATIRVEAINPEKSDVSVLGGTGKASFAVFDFFAVPER
jgi:hypothetical protein